MDCEVGDLIQIPGQDGAIYRVESIPRFDPPEYLSVRRVQGSSSFCSGLLDGVVFVTRVPSWMLKPA